MTDWLLERTEDDIEIRIDRDPYAVWKNTKDTVNVELNGREVAVRHVAKEDDGTIKILTEVGTIIRYSPYLEYPLLPKIIERRGWLVHVTGR